ncbi:histone deacetylase [Ferrimonas gelatinilytica]|uniref:Histone deacetylase n=1 Tax=Ferrimonas gelatinilytica TaxID=1255257 RepID=A0ABP9RYV4_9GAMM
MMHCVYDPLYSQLVLPERHRYPISKYGLLHQALQATDLPIQWHRPQGITPEQLALVHDTDYLTRFLNGTLSSTALRRIGFPWSEQLVQRTLRSCGGTLATATLAVEHGVACHLSGGYHHAHHDFGSGFCIFNDLVVTAATLQQQGLGRVLIFDCDVHQGDGSATLAADKPEIITVSLHCEKNFPARKPPSDVDIPLPRQMGDDAYLDSVTTVLPWVLSLYQPELVLYDAGVDIHQEDALGHLAVSTEGLYRRDRAVLAECRQRGIPVAAVIGGGYADDPAALTPRHLQLFHAAEDTRHL